MAIADKLTYLNETKSQIKSMINYGLETPLTNEPFRDYVSSIFKAFIQSLNNPDTLWGNLPKITGTGTNISLNNTIEAPMKIELSASELSQSGTPTPSSPQDIHTISGSNTIKVEGKNLFDKSTATSGKMINKNTGNPDNDSSTTCSDYINVKGVSNVILSGTTISYSNGGAFYDKDKTYISGFSSSAIKSGLSIVNDAYYIRFNLLPADINTTQLEKGNTATTYTPYVSQEADIDLDTIDYCKIGTYSDRIFKNVSGDTDYSSEREEGAWYIKKNIGKYILPNNVGGYNSGSNWYYIGNSNFENIKTTSGTPIICNYFENINLQLSGNENANGIYNIGTHIVIRNTALSSTSDYQTWLTNNEVILQTQLATPTYTKITGTLAEQLENVYQKLLSYDNTTNISQINNDLAFQLGVQAIEKL